MIEKNFPPLDIVVRVGDLHVGRFSNSMVHYKITRQYYKEFLIPKVKKLAEDNPNRNIFVLFYGDQYDNKQQISHIVNNDFIDLNVELSQYCYCYYLVGNHDTPMLDDISINANKSFTLVNKMEVVSTPIAVKDVNNEQIILSPWIHKLENIKKLLSYSQKIGAVEFHGHNNVYGFNNDGGGPGIKKEGNVGLEDFAHFREVVMGHIHTRQELRNVRYIGSPYQTRWQESGNSNFIEIKDYQTGKTEFMENTISPKYKKYNYIDLLQKSVTEVNNELKGNFNEIFVPQSQKPFNTLFFIENFVDVRLLKFTPIGEEIIENGEVVEKEILSVEEYYAKYVDEISAIVHDKSPYVIGEDMKDFFKSQFSKDYKEQTSKVEE